jgi:hypothetical protein
MTDRNASLLNRLVRWLVIVFVPWVALWKTRHQLWLACLVIRNDARARLPEDSTRLRWADEMEHDGWRIWKPYDKFRTVK